jgi:small subunit ribosomal protein S3
MAAQKHFIDMNLQYVQVTEFLNRELKLAGQGKIEIHKTPMGHRVVIHAVRLGMVIGRRGRNIRNITDVLEHKYGLETPQLEVKDLENPRLNSRVMAGRLISQIQKGFHFRRAGYALVRRIMSAEARGCEITIKGKLTSQRARSEVFREGFVAKCGEPAANFVDETVMEVTMKQGVIGVNVKIMQPNVKLPDVAELIPNVFGTPEDDVLAPTRKEEEEIEKIDEAEKIVETEDVTTEEEQIPEEEETKEKSNDQEKSDDQEKSNDQEKSDDQEKSSEEDLLSTQDFKKDE